MNHRNRTAGFVLLGLIVGSHLSEVGAGAGQWAALFLCFLAYPQIAWMVSRLSPRPFSQEMWNMRADALVCGAWVAAIHFPLWVSFALSISVVMGLTLFRGLKGLAESVLAWLAGAGVLVAITGWAVQPQTSWPVTWTALAALTAYLVASAVDNHQRSMRMHTMSQQLKQSEQRLQHQIEEIHLLQARLQEQAIRDPLTGLYNRLQLDEVMQRELERCRRRQLPLSLVLIDLDHFKSINDRWGHQVGDEVLRNASGFLDLHTRSSDWCFRYGGEEFLLILPETPLATALQKAEALRESYEAQAFDHEGVRIPVQISAGVASYPVHGTDLRELVDAADRALYRAKDEGRNRVVSARD